MDKDEAIKKLSGWVEVKVNEALEDKAFVTNVYYEGRPAIVSYSEGELTFTVIQPSDFWSVPQT